MPRKPVEENRRAENINPEKSGIRTGNPQLAPREDVRAASRRQSRPARDKRPPVRAKEGDRTG